MKKKILITLMLLASVGLVTGCGKKTEEKPNNNGNNGTNVEETKVEANTNEDIIKDQVVSGLDITNTSLTYKDGVSEFTATVTNNTGADFQLYEFWLAFKDAEGKTIIKIPGYIGEVLKAGESRTINSSVSEDLRKAVSVEYTDSL